MKIFIQFVSFIMMLFALTIGYGKSDNQTHSTSYKDAEQKTIQLLTDPALRQQYLLQHPDALSVDQEVKRLGGNSENTEKMYTISADVFQDLLKNNGNDPAQLQEILHRAKANPKAFYNSLSPKQQQAIRELAKDIEQNRK